jgi:hypothetical protein
VAFQSQNHRLSSSLARISSLLHHSCLSAIGSPFLGPGESKPSAVAALSACAITAALSYMGSYDSVTTATYVTRSVNLWEFGQLSTHTNEGAVNG